MWLAREGFARLSGELFALDKIDDSRIHLTNMAIQLKGRSPDDEEHSLPENTQVVRKIFLAKLLFSPSHWNRFLLTFVLDFQHITSTILLSILSISQINIIFKLFLNLMVWGRPGIYYVMLLGGLEGSRGAVMVLL